MTTAVPATSKTWIIFPVIVVALLLAQIGVGVIAVALTLGSPVKLDPRYEADNRANAAKAEP